MRHSGGEPNLRQRADAGRGRNARGAALGVAFLIALAPAPPVWATGSGDGQGASGQDSSGQGATTPVESGAGKDGAGQDSATAGKGSSQDQGGSSAAAGSGTKAQSNGGGAVRYGGRATGPSPLPLLEADPKFTPPTPPVNKHLPEGIDARSQLWQSNAVCDPVSRPGVEAFAQLMAVTYDRPHYSTFRPCIDLKSEHYDGRALDWSMNAFDPADRRLGDSVATWLTENDGEMAKRFGIQGVIWNAHTWRADTAQWQGYVGRSAHTDHMHFSFSWDGANMRTSWWTGVAVTEPDRGPCQVVAGTYAAIPMAPRLEDCTGVQLAAPQAGYATVRPGGTGAGLDLVQPLLDVPQTGVLDEPTRAALIAWQSENGVPQTGVLDQFTYAAALGMKLPDIPAEALSISVPDFATTEFTPYLRSTVQEGDTGPAVKTLQAALGAKKDTDFLPDGIFGPMTAEHLAAYLDKQGLPTVEVMQADPLVWHLLELREHPTLTYRYTELVKGDGSKVADGSAVTPVDGEPAAVDKSAVVKVLQDHLGVETDGIFGPVTEQAVKDAQQEAGLEPTGVVDGPTWAAVDKGTGLKAFHRQLKAEAAAAEQERKTAASKQKKSDGAANDGAAKKSSGDAAVKKAGADASGQPAR